MRISITPEVYFHINKNSSYGKYIVKAGRAIFYFTSCQEWAFEKAQQYNNRKKWYQRKAKVIYGKPLERILMKSMPFKQQDILGK